MNDLTLTIACNTAASQLRLASIHHQTVVHGPGPHSILHFQGCSFRCPDCINPDLQALEGGSEMMPTEVVAILHEEQAANGLAGVVLSGGEPLLQASGAAALLALCRREFDTDVGLIVFTGFDLESIRRDPERQRVIANADLIIAGTYRPGLDIPEFPYTASKTMHFLTDRYGPADFAGLPRYEIRYAPDHITLLGFPSQKDISNFPPIHK